MPPRSCAVTLLAASLTWTTASTAAASWDLPPHRATVFLDFEGGVLTPGTNSSLMQATCSGTPVEIPAFTDGDAARQAIVEQFVGMLAPYGVRVTSTRPPPELPYTRIILGGGPELFGASESVVGYPCNNDCGDSWWRDTAIVFSADEAGPNTLANAAVAAYGILVGLNFVADFDDAMRGFGGAGDLEWSTHCLPLSEEAAKCAYLHEEFCPPGEQNDDAELRALFGYNDPDTVAPVVEIVEPADGAVIAGADLEIVAELGDDNEGFGWKLVLRRDDVVLVDAPAYAEETQWQLSGLQPGVYEVEVAAIDHDRNVGRDVVTVQIGASAPDPGGSSSGEDPGIPTTGGATGEQPTDTGGGDTDTAASGEIDGPKQGCGCASTRDPGAALLILVALPGLLRRRRRLA